MTKQIQKTINALAANGMPAVLVKTKEEAYDAVKSMLEPGATVGVGGSETLKQTGILNLIMSGEYCFFNRYDPALSSDERSEMLYKALTADYFLCSSNAITENGELVNVDGLSNRCAALLFGPKKVIIVAGVNKIVPDVAAGIRRVREIAAPKNTVRLSCETYCAKEGHCVYDGDEPGAGCKSDQRICCNYVVSAKQRENGRINVVLCEEPLGY